MLAPRKNRDRLDDGIGVGGNVEASSPIRHAERGTTKRFPDDIVNESVELLLRTVRSFAPTYPRTNAGSPKESGQAG
jgi:hypothetical protein